MKFVGKILTGVAVGVAAVAVAPFTGGGSVLAGASLLTSLAGAGGIASIVGVAGGAVGVAAQKVSDSKKDNQEKDIREDAFLNGVKHGCALTVEEVKKAYDFVIASTALSYFFARCDGSISKEEEYEIAYDLDEFAKNTDIPEKVKEKIEYIKNKEDLTFDEVKTYLDNVSVDTLNNLRNDIDEIIEASDGVTAEENAAKQLFCNYVTERCGIESNIFDESFANRKLSPETAYVLASTALSYFFANCDGSISEEEQYEIDMNTDCDLHDTSISKSIQNEIKSLATNRFLSFESIRKYLDLVSVDILRKLSINIDSIIKADNIITNDEKAAKQLFNKYVETRKALCNGNDFSSDNSFFNMDDSPFFPDDDDNDDYDIISQFHSL